MRAMWYGAFVFCLLLVPAGLSRADDQVEAGPVLDKALKAMGGEAKVAPLKTASLKGKITGNDGGLITVTFDASYQGLDQYRVDAEAQVNGMSHKGLIVVNGNKVWAKHEDKTEEVPETIAAFIKDIFHSMRSPQLLAAYKGKEFKLAPLGEVKVGDRAALGLSISHKDRKDINLFFDKENGQPLKSEVRLTDPQGKDITLECLYSDYKETDGLKHPMKITIKADGKEFVMELTEIKPEEKLDESVFSKP